MSIKVLGSDGNPFDQNSVEVVAGRKLRSVVLLKLSGNYASGGDALDLTNGGGAPANPTTLIPAQARGVEAIDLMVRGTSAGIVAAGGGYVIVTPNGDAPMSFTDIQNLKLKVFATAGVELGAGAYSAGALADVIEAEIIWLR